LDVPRGGTMVIWCAETFGLAQLHQLRGRVGRARAQGAVCPLTEEGADLPEETLLRLKTAVENDRPGSGFAISLRGLELRGGGDIAGDDQVRHARPIGAGYDQKLLSKPSRLCTEDMRLARQASLNLGISGSIPEDYGPDAVLRLGPYARILRATSSMEIDDLEEEGSTGAGSDHILRHEPPTYLEVLEEGCAKRKGDRLIFNRATVASKERF
jgi:transcription-repair coupling factor (superfamily II helicase)